MGILNKIGFGGSAGDTPPSQHEYTRVEFSDGYVCLLGDGTSEITVGESFFVEYVSKAVRDTLCPLHLSERVKQDLKIKFPALEQVLK